MRRDFASQLRRAGGVGRLLAGEDVDWRISGCPPVLNLHWRPNPGTMDESGHPVSGTRPQNLHRANWRLVSSAASGYLRAMVTSNEDVDLLDMLKDVVAGLRNQLDSISIDNDDVAVLLALKHIIDTSYLLARLTRKAGYDVNVHNHVMEVCLRAERKAGQWLNKYSDEPLL